MFLEVIATVKLAGFVATGVLGEQTHKAFFLLVSSQMTRHVSCDSFAADATDLAVDERHLDHWANGLLARVYH